MKQQHARTLQALFSHPVHHDLRMSDVEALLHHVGIRVEHLSDHRFKLQQPNGLTLTLHAAPGLHHSFLDEDGVLRLRRYLKQGGITPEHPLAETASPHGDQSRRLVMHLDHRGARLWWLMGDKIETSELHPHGLWNSHQRLSHRHDRDMAGQRAPVDHAFLNQLSDAVLQADRVLLLGHGHGESDLRLLLRKHIEQHHPDLIQRLEVEVLDDTASTEAELLAVARTHFGNQPQRHFQT
jgi:hypothetical protein